MFIFEYLNIFSIHYHCWLPNVNEDEMIHRDSSVLAEKRPMFGFEIKSNLSLNIFNLLLITIYTINT